jgi:bis(5'-nucleosyl)-tetraphosphatase (symmetrical)
MIHAIGDIQGCDTALGRLLDKIGFQRDRDRLWLTGDLVNRGPGSVEVLRRVKNLGESAVTVLGNHDLHLLAVAAGTVAPGRTDTLDDVLAAPDREDLIDWLRRRPLLHHDRNVGACMVHAGLAPSWSIDEAARLAAEVEARLREPGWKAFLAEMYGDEPAAWNPKLVGSSRLRAIVNYLTRMRFCAPDGKLHFDYKGPPGTQPAPLIPWYAAPGRKSVNERIICGHWSALGARQRDNVFALDSGCVWGGHLTALRIDGSPAWTSVECNNATTL